MWIMEHVFGLVPEMMLAKPDECRGKILLAEINAGGYFGMDMQKQNDSHYFVSWLKRRARTLLESFCEVYSMPYKKTADFGTSFVSCKCIFFY